MLPAWSYARWSVVRHAQRLLWSRQSAQQGLPDSAPARSRVALPVATSTPTMTPASQTNASSVTATPAFVGAVFVAALGATKFFMPTPSSTSAIVYGIGLGIVGGSLLCRYGEISTASERPFPLRRVLTYFAASAVALTLTIIALKILNGFQVSSIWEAVDSPVENDPACVMFVAATTFCGAIFATVCGGLRRDGRRRDGAESPPATATTGHGA